MAKWVINGFIIAKEIINIFREVAEKKLLNIILTIGRDLKEKARNIKKYKDFSEEEKESKRECGRNRYRNMKKMHANRMLKRWNISFLHSTKMSKKILKLDNVEVNKKKVAFLGNQLL